MFTGIVEEVGVLRAVERRGDIAVFAIDCRHVIEDLEIGDSIAVNGVCLTAVAVRGGRDVGDAAEDRERGSDASGDPRGDPSGDPSGDPQGGEHGSEAAIGIAGAGVGTGTGAGDSAGRSLRGAGFDVELVPETLRRTALGQLASGRSVNLERSLAADGRFGGHVVQGHVDTTGTVVDVAPDGEGGARLIRVHAPRDVLRYVVVKGYIAIDGTSLTVVDVDDAGDTFSVALIPHTLAHTIAGSYARETQVNLEVDIFGKYIERLVVSRLGAPDSEEAAG